jgi:hypothetical protein
MAAWLNKWCLISFVMVFPLISGKNQQETGIVMSPAFRSPHPFHVSTTEINHNAAEKTLEISCRIFTDDFESALVKQYNTKADFSNTSLKNSMDSLAKKYILLHLQLKAEGKPVTMTYLGFEKENEAVYVYLQADKVATVTKIEATNSILHNLYDDQINIMHVIVGGNRKSSKIDYPNTQAVFTF